MSFLSREFAILFAILLLTLVFVRGRTTRKICVLVISAIFYAWAGWRFLFLLGSVTVMDFWVATRLAQEHRASIRRSLLALSVSLNLGFLFVFKYAHFAAYSIDRILHHAPPNWTIALPIGISFYTFETLSYVIDVYRGTAAPAHSLLDYAVFVSFFPRLVAGPIMRAHQFLPQLAKGFRMSREGFAAGAQLVAMGALKKLVIADNLGIFVDRVYSTPSIFTPGSVWAVVLSYPFQIYLDFSAYTDMATGIARILGITLPPNFRLPYTAQSVTEYWQRWHLSLSTWLRDYLYIPLGGNRGGPWETGRNLMITMLLGGLWHGANWTFVVFGGVHGLLMSLERLLARGRRIEPLPWSNPVAWLRTAATFATLSLAFVLFRSPNLYTVVTVYRKLAWMDTTGIHWIYWSAPVFVPVLWLGGFVLRAVPERPWPLAWSNPLLPAVLVFVALCLILFRPLAISPFIYFRF